MCVRSCEYGFGVCMYLLASFPGPHAAFGCTKECRGPGRFPHVRDVEGRKVVERT